jgi:hypothetical protein
MTASVLATQAIADSLGITVSKTPLITSIAQDGESKMQRVIGAAALLCANACSQRLTTQHINRVLLSQRKPPLLGDDNSPLFTMHVAPFDQHELCFFKEFPVNLDALATSPIPLPTSQPFSLEYLLTEGVPKDKRSLSNRRLLAKPPKIDRSASIPASTTALSLELTQRSPISIIRQVYDTSQLVSDVANGDLQLYFIHIINLLRDHLVYSIAPDESARPSAGMDSQTAPAIHSATDLKQKSDMSERKAPAFGIPSNTRSGRRR